jgi:TldD protein
MLFLLSHIALAEDLVILAAEKEMLRSFTILQEQEEPVYWIGLGIHDTHNIEIQATNGAASYPLDQRYRYLDIDLRVGNYQLDNTHKILDGSYFDEPTHFDYQFPISDDSEVIERVIWKGLDEAYRSSLRRLIKIKTNSNIKVERKDKSDDFSAAKPVTYLEEIEDFSIDNVKWQNELRSASALFLNYQHIIDSRIVLSAEQSIRRTLTTEGSTIREVRTHYRVSAMAITVAEDGMELQTYEYLDFDAMNKHPSTEEIQQLVHQAAQKAESLREAPLIDPYVGPAILRGRASAVFFHEILGHRVEGHRQKDEDEGQTLTDKVGQEIFPNFISIIDDPSLQSFEGLDLNGFYQYDDEGVKGQSVVIVENGVLKNFLMSRAPIDGFPSSNGHGRREEGHAPVSRQGNLIVTASQTISFEKLKSELLKEIKKQDKPFGLIFDDISGGFTFTGRTTPNSYSVKPVTVWKVYPDGREEMVRGVDMIGTPLLTFSRIAMASDQQQVFNGMCGAESGWVPVSAIAPDLLVTEVEVQRRRKDNDKPPILPAPTGAVQ